MKDRNRRCILCHGRYCANKKCLETWGFRKLKGTNKALLTKLAWKTIKDRDSLWVSMFRSKYVTLAEILESFQNHIKILILGKEFVML